MNLEATMRLLNIQAGGPGSGRRVSEFLEDKGFQRTRDGNRDAGAVYQHPETKLRIATDDRYESWRLHDNEGSGVKDLEKHLKSLDAGGPGSGRKKSTGEISPKKMANIRSDPRQKSIFGPGHTKELQKFYKVKAVEEIVESEVKPISRKPGKTIEQVGTQFCVRGDTKDVNLGCYPSKGKANLVKNGKSFIEDDIQAKKAKKISNFKLPLAKTQPSSVDAGNAKLKTGLGHRQLHPSYIKMNEPKLDKVTAGGPGSGRHKVTSKPYEGYNEKGKRFFVGEHHVATFKQRQEAYRTGEPGVVKYGKAWYSSWNNDGIRKLLGLDQFHNLSDLPKMGHTKIKKEDVEEYLNKYIESKNLKAYADYGEPMAGAMGHAHIDPMHYFTPPSLKNKKRIPTDDPMEKDDKFGDVTKRKSKDTKDQRMKLLKRGGPGGLPPQVPVHTTGIAPHTASYLPGMFSSGRRRRNGGSFRGYGAAKI